MTWKKRRWSGTMTDNPWHHIEPPTATSAINARRVDAGLPWDFFWARSADRRMMLTLRHAASSSPATRLPQIRDIEVTLSDTDQYGTRALGLKLRDSSLQDIFHTLCVDIVSAAARAASEPDAVNTALRRTWRWHHLLRGGRSGLLSPEEQKGLIGELLVLERFLLPLLPASVAVAAWLGPLGSPKDFEVGLLAIEAKARRGSARPYVAITSEHQLDSEGVDALFLHVVELSVAPETAADSFSVSDLAARVRGRIVADDPGAEGAFDGLLAAAGLQEEDDYADSRWVEGRCRVYAVGPDFPRITAATPPPGVERVTYSVALNRCEPFEIPDSQLRDAIAGLGGLDADRPR